MKTMKTFLIYVIGAVLSITLVIGSIYLIGNNEAVVFEHDNSKYHNLNRDTMALVETFHQGRRPGGGNTEGEGFMEIPAK